jgi:tetratricopeptide (TPR) repeat protein
VPSVPRTALTPPPPRTAPIEPPSPSELGVPGIAVRALGLDKESYFAVLGLPEAAPPEAVRAAFFRLAKIWHPDRLPAELEAAREEARAIYDQMVLAHRTLTNADLRSRYVATRRPTLKKRRDQLMRDVELAIERHDYLDAEAQARTLCESDPDDAVSLALLGWAVAWAADGPEDALRASLRMLERAIALDRECDRAYVYRGLIHRRLGDAEAAYRDFARALQINPRNTVAEREVRIHEIRTRQRR